MTVPHDVLDARLNAYLRATAPHGRETVAIGPLLATFDPASDNPYLNYAIPEDGAHPSPSEIAAFVDAADARDRIARLEYAPGAAPTLEALLLAAGFEVEMRPAIMTCLPGRARAESPDFRLSLAQTEADFAAAAPVLNAAYAEHGLDDAGDPHRLAALVAAGGLVAIAHDLATGAPAAAGMLQAPAAGVAEVAGIGTAPPFRSRGAAGALAGWLAQAGFARGVELAFLTPGVPAAQRAYARAGFVATSEMLMIGRPAGPPADP